MGTESFKQPIRKAYQGRCLVIIKSGKTPGDILLKADSDGLTPAEIVIASQL
jgi:beta-galactosidase